MTDHKTIGDIFTEITQDLHAIDAEIIIAHVLQKNRVFVVAHKDHALTQQEVDTIKKLATKCMHGCPIAYITGKKEFYGRDFIVSEETLVPRPETELLISTIIEKLKKESVQNILFCDIGTGSGIIPITLKKELDPHNNKKGFSFIATDISKEALDVAQKNSCTHNANNISFFNADLLNDQKLRSILLHTSKENIIITANLPYVDIEDREELLTKKESFALKHEPHISLWSSDFGLSYYKKLITQTQELADNTTQQKNICSFYEIDPKQVKKIKEYITHISPQSTIIVFRDLAHRPRLIQWSLH